MSPVSVTEERSLTASLDPPTTIFVWLTFSSTLIVELSKVTLAPQLMFMAPMPEFLTSMVEFR